MSSRSRSGLWDELTAEPVTFFTVVIFLGLAGPALLVAFRDRVTGWLLAHHVLVGTEQAVVMIPSTSVGLDARRLIVLGLLLVAAAAAAALAAHRGGGHPRKASRAVSRRTAQIVAALTAARWPTGQRVIDIDEQVLADLVVPHLDSVLRPSRPVRDRARRSDRRRP